MSICSLCTSQSIFPVSTDMYEVESTYYKSLQNKSKFQVVQYNISFLPLK